MEETPRASSADGSAKMSAFSSSSSGPSLIETNQFLRTAIPLYSSANETNRPATEKVITDFKNDIKELKKEVRDLKKDKKILQSEVDQFELEKKALESSHQLALKAERGKAGTIYGDALKECDELRNRNSSLMLELQLIKSDLENTKRR